MAKSIFLSSLINSHEVCEYKNLSQYIYESTCDATDY